MRINHTSQIGVIYSNLWDFGPLLMPNRLCNAENMRSQAHSTKSVDVRDRSINDAYLLLHSLPAFSELPPNELKSLANSCRFEILTAGDYITVEGDESSLEGFIVVSGRLALMKSSPSGKQLAVELLAPGDMFGLLLTLSLEKMPAQLSASRLGELLAERCIDGFRVRRGHIGEALARNPILVTALNSVIGYELGAATAKRAYAQGRPIRLDDPLHPRNQRVNPMLESYPQQRRR